MTGLAIDLGCGGKKKAGTLGVDKLAGPEVDHVVDFERDPLPFADRSVSYVHLSHCLEHIVDPLKLFAEISRVAEDGARLDIWGPYAWENSAFIYDHKNFFTEDHFYHPCVWFPDFWRDILRARWLLHGFTYIVPEDTLRDVHALNMPLALAIRHWKGVVKEFGVHIEIRQVASAPSPEIHRHLAMSRDGARYRVPWDLREPTDKPAPLPKILQRLKLMPVEAGSGLDGGARGAAGEAGS